MRFLDPETILLLHHLESEDQIRQITEEKTGLKPKPPVARQVQQYWERLWAA